MATQQLPDPGKVVYGLVPMPENLPQWWIDLYNKELQQQVLDEDLLTEIKN